MKFLKHVAFAAAMGCVSISAFAVGHYSPNQGYAYDVVRHGVMISEKCSPMRMAEISTDQPSSKRPVG